MRIARGACWVIAYGLLCASVLAILDAVVRLPAWSRGLGLAVWLTSFGFLTWLLVVRRWAIETSSRAERAAAKELSSNVQAAATAIILILGCLLAALFVPHAMEHIRRIAMPWDRPPASQYRIIVTSSEPVVSIGEPVTLSAYPEKLDSSAPIPEEAYVHLHDAAGNELTLRMKRDESGAFHAIYPTVSADFTYRIEIGGATSDWYSVTAVRPAEVTGDSILEVSPPAYAAGIIPRQTFAGFESFNCLQHGKIELTLRFSRPVVNARLEWRTEPNGADKGVFPNLTLKPDNSWTAALQLKETGFLRLITAVELNGKKHFNPRTINVNVFSDSPPRFDRIKGLSYRPLSVRPGQSLPIELTVLDDIAIGEAALEYVIGKEDATPATLPIPMTGLGTSRADGHIEFDLPGKLRGGEIVRYRIRVTDNRRVLEPELKPHEIVFPEAGWATVGLDNAAPPLDIQEIEGQRDFVVHGLMKALEENNSLADETQNLLSETRNKFERHHPTLLERIQKHQREVAASLQKLALNAALTPELRFLADSIREIASRFSSEADSLPSAITNDAKLRSATLTASINDRALARVRLEELMERSRALAQARVDCKRMEALIADELALAAKVKLDRNVTVAELAMSQKELILRLQQLVAASDPLKLAREDAKRNDVQIVTKRISELAAMVLALDSAIKKQEAEVRKELLIKIAAEDEKIAAKAADLLKRIEVAARLCGIGAPGAEEFSGVVKLIEDGKTVEALTELQRLAGSLEAMATAMDKWIADRTNAKLASRQLASWQEDLRTRFKIATGGNDANFDALPVAVKKGYQLEQSAIRGAVATLDLPLSRELAAAREGALAQVDKVAKCLSGTGGEAEASMTRVVASLNRLSDKTPSISERLAKSRSEFEEVQKEQLSISQLIGNRPDVTVPGALQALMARLELLVPRQRKQLVTFAALDLPGMDARRKRILIALGAASADLERCCYADIDASQKWVNREFERLKLVLDRSPAPDERIDEFIAHLEVIAASEAKGVNLTKEQLNAHANALQGINWRLTQIATLEAPALKNDAQLAVQNAESAFQDVAKHEARSKQTRTALAAMRKLVDRVVGAESDYERIQRLSWNRYLAATKAQALVGANPNRAESDEARRQLEREIDELICTRTGLAGQQLKINAFNKYKELRVQAEPDHQVKLQKDLAQTLDELAASMADIAECTAVISRELPPSEPMAADSYIPSRHFVDELRGLARQSLDLRERLNHVGEEVSSRLDPGKQHEARASELIEKMNEVSEVQQRIVHERGPADPVSQALSEAGKEITRSAKLLVEARENMAAKKTSEAEKCRSKAQSLLASEADRLAKIFPSVNPPLVKHKVESTLEMLSRAESSMRRATDQLTQNGDILATEKMMRSSVEALEAAIGNRMHSIE